MASNPQTSATGRKAQPATDSSISPGGGSDTKTAPEGETKVATGPVSPQQRHHMIAVAAYYLAERRGFCPGCETDDWLAAQEEIDRQLGNRDRTPN